MVDEGVSSGVHRADVGGQQYDIVIWNGVGEGVVASITYHTPSIHVILRTQFGEACSICLCCAATIITTNW